MPRFENHLASTVSDFEWTVVDATAVEDYIIACRPVKTWLWSGYDEDVECSHRDEKLWRGSTSAERTRDVARHSSNPSSIITTTHNSCSLSSVDNLACLFDWGLAYYIYFDGMDAPFKPEWEEYILRGLSFFSWPSRHYISCVNWHTPSGFLHFRCRSACHLPLS